MGVVTDAHLEQRLANLTLQLAELVAPGKGVREDPDRHPEIAGGRFDKKRGNCGRHGQILCTGGEAVPRATPISVPILPNRPCFRL
jgi:hypothetical protein